MSNIAFMISDSAVSAILSGINDNEYAWKQVGVDSDKVEYKHKYMDNITLCIDKDKYIYTISCKDALNIQLMTYDLKEELSDKVDINTFLDRLMEEENVSIICNDTDNKSLELNMQGKVYRISETTTRLMRGSLKNIEISF